MKIVLHNRYPVENLPEDIRPDEFEAGSHVRLVIEPPMSDEEVLAEFEREIQKGLDDLAAGRTYTLEEVLAHIDERFGPQADAAE